jgi:hypothetical protein
MTFAGAAFAQTPTGDAYGGVAGLQQGSSGGGGGGEAPSQPASRPEAQGGGNLPFTGFELGMAALMGAGLLGTGLVLRRTLRSDAHA